MPDPKSKVARMVQPESLKSEDKADIEAKTEALVMASQKLGEKVYAESQAAAATASGAAGAGGRQAANEPPKASTGAADDNVVDAEFKEVKDRK